MLRSRIGGAGAPIRLLYMRIQIAGISVDIYVSIITYANDWPLEVGNISFHLSKKVVILKWF